MPAPEIDALPPVPLRTEAAGTFTPKAETFLDSLDTFRTQVNAFGDYLDSYTPEGSPTQEWAPNWTGDASWYLPVTSAMTIDQGNAQIGTGTITVEKSTNAAPGTFVSASLPVTLEAGAWLKVTASGVSGFCATHLVKL